MQHRKKGNSFSRYFGMMIALSVVLVISTIVSLNYIERSMDAVDSADSGNDIVYERHYAMIANDMEDDFWQKVYDGAYDKGNETGVYVEAFCTNTEVDYSMEERLKMAIAAKVDGIIVEDDDNPEVCNLINDAVECGIPVVTVLNDSEESGRQGFVGVSSYNKGREYGRQIINLSTKQTKKVLVLECSEVNQATTEVICSGIQDTISNEGNHLSVEIVPMAVSDTGALGTEEVIRELFADEQNLPDIMICLNEQDTISACKAAEDYETEGKVDIIGTNVSEAILGKLENHVLAATVVVDADQMGRSCVKMMNEYIVNGTADLNQMLDVETVTQTNLWEYRQNGDKEGRK